jgi:nucleoid-associated protein YgaU
MAIGRYNRDSFLMLAKRKPTHVACAVLRAAVQVGTIESIRMILKEGQRLDHLAGLYYGNARLWWVIAAASGIGWPLQVPPGTVVHIPTNFAAIVAMFE